MLATFFILRRFVQSWVFKGICNDMFGEFMIEMDEQYLAYRGNYKNILTDLLLYCFLSVNLFLGLEEFSRRHLRFSHVYKAHSL